MNGTRPKLADRLLPALRRELFERALDGGTPPLSRRIFVNRNLRLDKIRFLGFDLDWTLADGRGLVVAGKRERVSDMEYLRNATRAQFSREVLPYERLMLEDWARSRLCRPSR